MDIETATTFLKIYANGHKNDGALADAVATVTERLEKKKINNWDDTEAFYYACPTCGSFWYSGDKVQREYCTECGQHVEYPV